jgi:hypothetical protein
MGFATELAKLANEAGDGPERAFAAFGLAFALDTVRLCREAYDRAWKREQAARASSN